MAIAIPFTSETPFYQFNTVIEGSRYYFNVRWNTRDEAWYFDLLDEDEDPIMYGIKIALGAALGGRSIDPRWPPGHFFAIDTSSESVDATLNDLGSRVIVEFYTTTELDAL